MKTFKEINEESEHGDKIKWIRHQIHNTERPHDEIKAEFLAKHGKQHEKLFDKHVHKEVD